MARLSEAQVRELLKSPKHKNAIARCQKQHEELRYHVQPVKDSTLVSPYHKDYMKWVQQILPLDKYKQFEKFFRFPVPTTDISERVFTQLERALSADNQYVRAEFNTPENAADFETYRVSLGDTTFWKTDAFESVKTAINSVILVDLPSAQNGNRPEPYYYLLEINPTNVHDIDFNKDGVAEYIIFNMTPNLKVVFDDESFRTVSKEGNQDWSQAAISVVASHSVYSETTGELVSGLGYTPARRLWDELLLPEHNRIQAKSPLSKLLGQMDEYLFDYYSLRYYKSYGTWPVLWEYENTAPLHQHPSESGIRCDKGYFLVPQEDAFVAGLDGQSTVVRQKPRVVPCEECKKSRYTGPGSIKRVTPPQKNGDPDLRNPVGFINPDPEILKQATEDLAAAKRSIIMAAVGSGGETDSLEARNEVDVLSGYEVTQSYLMNFKKNIEAPQKWTLETLAKFRYASDFLRATVDLGDEFFLKSVEAVKQEYKSGKDTGLPDYLLAPIREMVSETRYKNNDEQRMRQRILSNLQPYPDRTEADLQTWLAAAPALLSPTLLRLRMNFMSYIAEFEREQEMSIVEVASAISFESKITLIRERLLSYVERDFEGENVLVPKAAAPPVVENQPELVVA